MRGERDGLRRRVCRALAWGGLLAVVVLVMGRPATARADEPHWVWVEGEAPSRSTFVRHNWYDDVRKDALSGGEWLSHYHGDRVGEASYRIEVPAAGRYVLWVRANPLRAAMRWRVEDEAWQAVDFGGAREAMHVSPRPDHRQIAWVRVAELDLDAGAHTLSFRTASEAKLGHHGAIDAILLIDDPTFAPTGSERPDALAAVGGGPADWFPVTVGPDPFSPESVIDLSVRLPTPAGRFGFVQRDGDTLRFEHADEPVKFWGCTANVQRDLSREQHTQRARYLAKHGVNLVRHHAVFDQVGPLVDGRFDPERLDAFDWWHAQLKAHGIYSDWSVFYHHRIAPENYPAELYAELPNHGDTYGFVHLSRRIQDDRLRYVRALLEHVNPYTGLAYKDDPALAIVEVQNEDCIFFHHPLNPLAAGDKWPRHTERLRWHWARWLRQRYGSDEALREAWGTRDTLDAATLPLFGAWQFDARHADAPDRRRGDFIRFLTDLQRDWYQRWHDEVRAMGYRGATITTAWRAGGPAADPANLYCDTVGDLISRHNYRGGGAGGHSIAPGEVDTFTHMGQAGSGIVSLGMYQVEGWPLACTEWTQKPPNPWKAEAAPLVAFYLMGLQGMDASLHFAQSHAGLAPGWPGLSSYVTDTPHYIGQFPALALAVRRGDITEGPIAAARRLSVDDLFTGTDPLGQDFTGGGWDDKRLTGTLRTPQEVLAIGRVTVSFDGGDSQRLDWDDHWDRDAGVVRAATGELVWDTAQRVVLVQAQRTQGIVGFAGGGTWDLPDLRVEVTTPFVSLLFTSLDDEPIDRSRSVLITAMARDRQTGTEYADNGARLVQVGRPPLLMEPVQATVQVRDGAAAQVRVRPLDFHGVPRDEVVPVRDGAFTIDGTYRTYYYHLTRE